jgi:hypothetical protein
MVAVVFVPHAHLSTIAIPLISLLWPHSTIALRSTNQFRSLT